MDAGIDSLSSTAHVRREEAAVEPPPTSGTIPGCLLRRAERQPDAAVVGVWDVLRGSCGQDDAAGTAKHDETTIGTTHAGINASVMSQASVEQLADVAVMPRTHCAPRRVHDSGTKRAFCTMLDAAGDTINVVPSSRWVLEAGEFDLAADRLAAMNHGGFIQVLPTRAPKMPSPTARLPKHEQA